MTAPEFVQLFAAFTSSFECHVGRFFAISMFEKEMVRRRDL